MTAALIVRGNHGAGMDVVEPFKKLELPGNRSKKSG